MYWAKAASARLSVARMAWWWSRTPVSGPIAKVNLPVSLFITSSASVPRWKFHKRCASRLLPESWPKARSMAPVCRQHVFRPGCAARVAARSTCARGETRQMKTDHIAAARDVKTSPDWSRSPGSWPTRLDIWPMCHGVFLPIERRGLQPNKTARYATNFD